MTDTTNDRLLREALLYDLSRTEPATTDWPAEERHRRLARVLIDKALTGDLAAIREIYDRTEGRPMASSSKSSEPPPRRVVLQWAGDVEPGGLDAGNAGARP